MTAPGNSSLLLTLLAAFIASTGYAGGRLHQWYRMGRDRDEAYRDGYDTATRSVFSLAARVISPRRADRAAIRASAAVVLPASAVVVSAPMPASTPASPIRVAAGPEPTVTQPMSPTPGGRPAAVEQSGRHTVPDELVQADTYRLAPDRVARAKVRGAIPPAGRPMSDARSRPTNVRSEAVGAASRVGDVQSGAAGAAASPAAEATSRPAVPKPRSS